MCETKIQQDFIANKSKQGSDMKKYPKLVLNKLKIMGNFTSIYTYWTFSSRKFLKKISTYMWSMFIHMCPCAPMCEL
jgi:hypothetical protein